MDHREAAGGQNKELTLRPARAGEAKELSALALSSKGYWGYDDGFMTACADELTWSEGDLASDAVWVAEIDGSILGFCELRLDAETLEVDALYVDPRAIGGGVGKMLWRKAEEIAVAVGARAIGLDADPHAVGFYEHMGAVVTGEAPSCSIPGRMLPRMLKHIPNPDIAGGH